MSNPEFLWREKKSRVGGGGTGVGRAINEKKFVEDLSTGARPTSMLAEGAQRKHRGGYEGKRIPYTQKNSSQRYSERREEKSLARTKQGKCSFLYLEVEEKQMITERFRGDSGKILPLQPSPREEKGLELRRKISRVGLTSRRKKRRTLSQRSTKATGLRGNPRSPRRERGCRKGLFFSSKKKGL